MHAFTSWAEEKKFVRAIFYPQHEETLRRMDISSSAPYYARVKHPGELSETSEYHGSSGCGYMGGKA